MPNVDGVDGTKVLNIIERVERLGEEQKALAEDVKEILDEAKASGYNVKIIRKIIALRKMDPEKRSMENIELETYMQAVGMDV